MRGELTLLHSGVLHFQILPYTFLVTSQLTNILSLLANNIMYGSYFC